MNRGWGARREREARRASHDGAVSRAGPLSRPKIEHGQPGVDPECRTEQPERMADVAVAGRLRPTCRHTERWMRGIVELDERDAAVRIVTVHVAPVEGPAADDERQRYREPACEPTPGGGELTHVGLL